MLLIEPSDLLLFMYENMTDVYYFFIVAVTEDHVSFMMCTKEHESFHMMSSNVFLKLIYTAVSNADPKDPIVILKAT